MHMSTRLRSLALFFSGCVAALILSSAAVAQHGGGGHGGGVGGHGGYGYGGYHGGYGWHGGYWHGGYGWYGWRGYGYYGPWGWGWGWGGVGLGLYVATLPLYYSTVWWNGVPYYYGDNTYYRWNGDVGQYETVAPPPNVQNQTEAQGSGSSELIAYPKNGQSAEQQGKDKFECHRWAAGQTGFDPTQPAGATASARRSDYFRAQGACLEGRGYSVR
jgi:hypothetical protein